MEKYQPNISVCIQLISNEQVLLMRRLNTGYQDGKYEYPSGHIEKGESLIDAAVRETREEVGIEINANDLEFVGCVDNHTSGKHVNFLFRTSTFLGTPIIMEPNDCDDLMWVRLTDLSPNMEELSVDTKRFVDMVNSNCVLKSYTGEENFSKVKGL